MKINTDAKHFFSSQRAPASTAASTGPASFSAALTAATAGTASVKQADFTSMTRQEMFDWINDQIRRGEMSVDESSPFVGMTMKRSANGQPVDMATDATRIDFFEKARLGIEGALSRNELDSARRLQAAVEIMHRKQGQAIGADARA